MILSSPFVDTKVTINTHRIPRIPKVCVDESPNNDHVDVVSVPKIAFENTTQIPEPTFTIQIMYEAYHIKVPTKAYLGPTDFSIHE